MSDSTPCERRIAVVTGAASGIGRATALALAREGATVVAVDLDRDGAARTAQQAARDARQAGREAGREAGTTAFGVDVADAAAVRSFAQRVLADVGTPDVLVNCAGWDQSRPFIETDPSFWERVVKINLLGVVAVTHAFLGAMIERGTGGRVVNVASDAGRVGSSGETVYAGAKGGVIAFTKSLARETARHGITANTVCPGPTDTPLFRAQPERLQEALIKAVPMRRPATPEDIAHAICFFASPRSAYITGQVLSVSGGLTMAG
jgi:2-hydroxycyclohexanecarboxyl-CoA dehydrogenase